jgi:large conductance mechanosensitive channel
LSIPSHELTAVTTAAAEEAGAATINLVVFLQAIFDFIILAFVTFMAVKQVTRFKIEAPLLLRNSPRCGNKTTLTI